MSFIAESMNCGNIYLIHLSDTGWCTSFNQGLTSENEIIAVINRKRELLNKNQLHYTLVGLGTNSTGKVGQIADKVILLNRMTTLFRTQGI